MELAVIIEILIEQITIWAPSIIACLTTLVGVITGINKLKQAAADMKKDESFKQLHQDLIQQHQENQEIKKQNALILEKLTGVKGFYQAQKKEEETNDKSAD